MAQIRIVIYTIDEDIECPENVSRFCKKECRDGHCKEGISLYDAVQKGAYAIAKKRFGKNADAIQMSNALGWTECEDYASAVIDSLSEEFYEKR